MNDTVMDCAPRVRRSPSDLSEVPQEIVRGQRIFYRRLAFSSVAIMASGWVADALFTATLSKTLGLLVYADATTTYALLAWALQSAVRVALVVATWVALTDVTEPITDRWEKKLLAYEAKEHRWLNVTAATPVVKSRSSQRRTSDNSDDDILAQAYMSVNRALRFGLGVSPFSWGILIYAAYLRSLEGILSRATPVALVLLVGRTLQGLAQCVQRLLAAWSTAMVFPELADWVGQSRLIALLRTSLEVCIGILVLAYQSELLALIAAITPAVITAAWGSLDVALISLLGLGILPLSLCVYWGSQIIGDVGVLMELTEYPNARVLLDSAGNVGLSTGGSGSLALSS